jgi:hypothetical protein
MLITLALLAFFGQQDQSPDPNAVSVQSCGSCWSKRIAHTFGTILFCVPRGMKVQRVAGFEGDIRDVITLSRRREIGKLIVLSDGNPSGNRNPPSDWLPTNGPLHSSVHAWRCTEWDGRDLRIDRDGRYWRMITFPFGYAEYGNVPANVSAQFDRVLDSLCCRPLNRSRP